MAFVTDPLAVCHAGSSDVVDIPGAGDCMIVPKRALVGRSASESPLCIDGASSDRSHIVEFTEWLPKIGFEIVTCSDGEV